MSDDKRNIEQVRAAQRLASFRDGLIALNKKAVLAASERGPSRTRKLEKLKAAVEEWPTLYGYTRHMRRLKNELTSIVEEAATLPKASLDALTMPANILEKVEQDLAKANAALDEEKAVEVEASRDDLRALQDRAKQLLRQTDTERKRLESLDRRPFTVCRVPVVPVTSGYVQIAEAQRRGLNVESLGGYALIKSQLVIGISREALPEEGKSKTKSLDYAKELLSQLEDSVGKKLFFVSSKSVFHGNGVWYWVADSRTLDALRLSIIGKTAVRDWGFGFSST